MRVYVGGTFDLLHYGHVRFLSEVAKIGDVIVGLNSDEFAARYKRPPVMSFDERREMLEALRCVSLVIPNEGDEDSRPAILKSAAKFVAHGDDWVGESLLSQMGLTVEWLREHGIGLLYVPYTKGISSSEVIERCRRSPRWSVATTRAESEQSEVCTGSSETSDTRPVLQTRRSFTSPVSPRISSVSERASQKFDFKL
jgi:glycerol-3-phosphate cytidylyltransferase